MNLKLLEKIEKFNFYKMEQQKKIKILSVTFILGSISLFSQTNNFPKNGDAFLDTNINETPGAITNSSAIVFRSSGYATDGRNRFQHWKMLGVGRSSWGPGDLAFYSNTDGAGYKEVLRLNNLGNVGIGTTNPDSRLTVKGNIHTQEVKVDLAGAIAPDYVFKENYNLKTLEEVEKHIQKEGHLPNIPSAKEMEEDGINLKEMNLKLLEKIEELTLYVIEMKKKNDHLEREVKTMSSFLKECPIQVK